MTVEHAPTGPQGLVGAIRYRVGQFASALGAAARPPDTAPARRLLPPRLLALFEEMPPADQLHGLRVLEALEALEAAGEDDAVLLQAALLHDVGKANAGVRVFHRVSRTLLAGRAPLVWRWLTALPTGWRRPFWVVAHHPERGAVWVETAGGDPDLVALIAHHERPTPGDWIGSDQARRHAALAAVDARL